MPNYCNNNLILTHQDPRMIKRAFKALERGEFLQEFIPVPRALRNTMSGGFSDPKKQAKLEAKNARNLAKYGYKDWYDYCVNEWGTKWDCGEQGASDIHPSGTLLHTAFDTAWAPPLAAYAKLEALGFGIEAMYYESGMNFAGTYSEGSDDYVDLGGMSADDIEQEYPDIDECFSIAESIREYERENQEELTAWIREGLTEKGRQLMANVEKFK